MSVRLIRKRIEQRHVQLSPHKTLWMTSNEQRYLLLHSNKRRRILRRDWRHLRLTWTFRGIIPLRFISSALFARSFIKQLTENTSIGLRHHFFIHLFKIHIDRFHIFLYYKYLKIKSFILINSWLNNKFEMIAIFDNIIFFLIFVVLEL